MTAHRKKLTPKQRAFIDAYFACGMNASAAARRAGYTNRPNTAASQLMSNNVIREEIDRIYRENTMPASETLARLSAHARADIGDITDKDGRLNMRKARAYGKTHLIRRIKQTTIVTPKSERSIIEVEMYDAQRAQEMLGRYHKLFVDRVQVDDWRSQAIQDIKSGALDYRTLRDLFDDTLAQELFRAAGIDVVVSDDE